MRVSASQPLAALPSQSPKSGLHVATAHAPAVQVAVALAREQALLQRPQWAVDVRVSASQPLAVIPSQSA